MALGSLPLAYVKNGIASARHRSAIDACSDGNIGLAAVWLVSGAVTEQERSMAKIAIRLLVLSMFTTSLLVTPIVAPVNAATTSNKHAKKKVRVTHQSPKAADPYVSPFSSNKYEDDFDRRNAGGGGGY